jgi:hypothetical protein
MHEYGHYLQEQKFGKLFYYTVGVSSKISWGVYMQIFKHPEGYRNTLTEVHANALAYEFFVPSFWDFKKYPITVKPESENLYPKY